MSTTTSARTARDKQPAPEFGSTWWSRRWIRSLESLGASYPNTRLPRGRSLARNGAVHGLEVQPGTVTAHVEQAKRTCLVTLNLPVFSDDQWAAGVRALAGQLQHAASLLEGRMPEKIDETLGQVELGLFPRRGELDSQCVCRDNGNPCAHGAAVHYTFANALEDNPFLLPALRGRSREELLAELRAVRSGGTTTAPAKQGLAASELAQDQAYFTGGDLSAVTLSPQLSVPSAHHLRRLGTPPGCTEADAELLATAVENAARHAGRLARGA
ncbi:SWIM zinc finger family protein [Streptomyces sp. NPDC021093]|uniref:SWIM zinc finger family protein n=1 Tax=Streptomyces sp. NPDC021093 TaxID=3365112 RepID=UPI00378F8D53